MEKTNNNKIKEKEYILSFEQIKELANSGYTIKDLKEKIKEFEK